MPDTPPPATKRSISTFKSKLKTKNSISIKGGLTEKSSNKEENSQEEDYINKPKTPFTQEQLSKVWIDYSNLCENKGHKMFANILRRFDPELKENFEINFGVEHSSADMEFQMGRVELLRYLRLKLNNYHLVLNTSQMTVSQEKKLYTNRDKFNRLIEKNEMLKEMQKKFNLEVDF